MQLLQELLNIEFLLKVQFTSQMVILTVTICLIPTVAHFLTKKQNRVVRLVVETFLFLASILGFSIWLFGTSILGFWIISTTIFILLLEIGSHIVDHIKITTLNCLADEVTFESLKNQAKDIEEIFRIGTNIYLPVPLSLIIGTMAGWLYNQTPKETILLCAKLVILLVSLFLLIFLFIGFLRMSDTLFHESNVSSCKLEKERKGIFRIIVKLYTLIVPQQFRQNPEKEAIELACTVSYLRKIYLYDTIHNSTLLTVLVTVFIQLLGININLLAINIDLKWLIISLFIALLFFNISCYFIGQIRLHKKIMKRYNYKGIKRIELLKKLREYSPRFPLLSLQSASSSNSSVNLCNFLFNRDRNNTLEEIKKIILLKIIENNDKQIKRLFDIILEKYKEDQKLMAEQPKYQQNFHGTVIGVAQNVEGNQNINPSKEKQTLAEAAQEIENLLKQLEQDNPIATKIEKIDYINDETSKGFKRRVVAALKAASETAIEEFLDNPYVNIVKDALKGWINPEG